MSTNIQIDVLLQRLKQVSDQTAQQNRSEKQEREEALLLAQQAAAEGNPALAELLGFAPSADPRNPQTSIDPITGRPTQERSAVPDLYKKKRPGAQRLETGKIAFCWHSLSSYDRYEDIPGGLAGAGLTNSGLLAYSLKISNATRTQTLEVRGPDVPFGTDFVAMLPVKADTGLFIWAGGLTAYAQDVPIPIPPGYVFPSPIPKVPISPAKATIVVLVTPDSLRQITPPSGLRDKMYAWEALFYEERDWALTRHFGMLLPQGISLENGSPFTGWFTPSVFKGLSGEVFGATASQRSNYAYMRQNYFDKAPAFFLAEEDFSAESYNPLRKNWRLTRFQPATIESVVPANQLRRAPSSFRFRLADNEVGDQFTYAWDWNDPKYCEQQLLALGFKPEDLKP